MGREERTTGEAEWGERGRKGEGREKGGAENGKREKRGTSPWLLGIDATCNM